MIIVRPLIEVLGKMMKLPKNSYLDPTTLGSGIPDGTKVLKGDSTWGTPASMGYVPYVGATQNVDLGIYSVIMNNGATDSEMSPSYFGVEIAGGTKYAFLEYDKLIIADSTIPKTMTVNANGLVFPDGSIQTTAFTDFKQIFLFQGC